MTDKPVNHIVAAARQTKEATSRDRTREIRKEMQEKRKAEVGEGIAAQLQANT
ncbi:MAG TPA: hypothetical protein VJJ20_02115 [Candidatus Paceibacterota bacterium]